MKLNKQAWLKWNFVILSLFPLFASAELTTVEADFRETPREFRLDGMVEAINQTTVSAQTQGQVQEILFDVDDYVENGQLLITLKDTEQKARLHRAEADLKEALARLQEAKDEYVRTKELSGKNLVSQSQLDKANASLKSARARQDAASAGLVQASEQLEYTKIRAPYSGIVTHRLIEVGEIARPGQKLMSGTSLDQLRVLVDVPQSLIPIIRKTGKARVQQPDNVFVEATKLTIFPFAHHGSNTFKVRVDLPEGIPDLFPGMFVKTAFVTGTKRELVVPVEAVVYRSEVTAVYVVEASGRVRFRHIRAGHRSEDGKMAVIAGLSAGDRVAIDPIAAGALLKQQMAEAGNE
ncbi:MAG: efflux transporter periplasmic adaptor subunit [endosymbiont of Seepiophila jonesi]|uniref:Efflux transporter periplasmic adaptor subunit n=1 Tax=endosymbiont of Lamellibrachia luymesi TaxID=2200907 RepID=A0A370DV78_9GAMM|nr:MAG: efflux transporter periplasmic adaptor subunit [endosymbiont of Lamellibrachia luymesi]RDH94205.1 MAG: efflux transporter periplasmic adaptor subunit [endosymbiont of Seepiophila jonesi]